MLKRIAPCMLALLGLALAVPAQADDSLAGVKCPVSGRPAVKKGVAEYKGGKVYFCCTNCPKTFAANTAKYSAKANHQLAKTGQAKQVMCPMKGKPVKAAHNITVDGVKVGFC